MESSEAMYDGASTIFSPDGRLFQVEYARKAIDKGTPTVGLKYKDGVILFVYKHVDSQLVRMQSLEKIFQIDDHIACAASGLVADARHLVELARDEAQMNKVMYDEQITVKTLVETVCDYKHLFTQFDGVRPFGVSLIVAGIDGRGKQLFLTDPSGAAVGYKAVCEGEDSEKAMAFFKNKYIPDLALNDALDLGVEALHKVAKKKMQPDFLEIAVIDNKKKFYNLSTKEIKSLMGRHS